MGVSVATTRVESRTGSGTQDITIEGFGTPKAAIFICTFAHAAANPRDSIFFSVGMTDGTEQICNTIYAECDKATTNTSRISFTDRVADVYQGSYDCAFDSFIEDGVRVDWTGNPTVGYYITVILFGGDDLSADVHECAPATGGTNITAPGFEPDLLIVVGVANPIPASGTHAILSLGLVSGGVSPVNRAVMFESEDDVAATEINVSVREDACCGQIHADAVTWKASAGTFDADGYTMTSDNDVSGDEVAVLALNFGGAVDCWVGTMDTPTSTGDDAQTGPSFTPQFVLLLANLMTAVGTVGTGSVGTIGTCCFDDTRESCDAASDEDGADTTDNQGLSADSAASVPSDDGSSLFAGTFKSFDANGWTINFSATDGTARKWPAMAIEAEGAGGDPEGGLVGGKLVGRGLLGGRLVA